MTQRTPRQTECKSTDLGKTGYGSTDRKTTGYKSSDSWKTFMLRFLWENECTSIKDKRGVRGGGTSVKEKPEVKEQAKTNKREDKAIFWFRHPQTTILEGWTKWRMTVNDWFSVVCDPSIPSVSVPLLEFLWVDSVPASIRQDHSRVHRLFFLAICPLRDRNECGSCLFGRPVSVYLQSYFSTLSGLVARFWPAPLTCVRNINQNGY